MGATADQERVSLLSGMLDGGTPAITADTLSAGLVPTDAYGYPSSRRLYDAWQLGQRWRDQWSDHWGPSPQPLEATIENNTDAVWRPVADEMTIHYGGEEESQAPVAAAENELATAMNEAIDWNFLTLPAPTPTEHPYITSSDDLWRDTSHSDSFDALTYAMRSLIQAVPSAFTSAAATVVEAANAFNALQEAMERNRQDIQTAELQALLTQEAESAVLARAAELRSYLGMPPLPPVCACGCGEYVRTEGRRWRAGHNMRKAGNQS